MDAPKNTTVAAVQKHVSKMAENPANLIAFTTVASTAAGVAATMFENTKLGAIAIAAQKLLGHADKLVAANQTVGMFTGGKTILHYANETLAANDEKFHQVANTIEKGLKSAPESALDKIKAGLARTGLVSGAETVATVEPSSEAANNDKFNQKSNARG